MARLPARRRLSNDPLQRLCFVALIIGSYLRMQEHSDRANHPMLPVVCSDDGDAFYFLVVVLYEPGMIFESRNILPAIKSGSINQQSDFSVLTDEGIDLRRNLAEVVGIQFLRRRDFQSVGGDSLCLDHAKPLSWLSL